MNPADPNVIYWRSKDGGPWERCEVGRGSIVSFYLRGTDLGDIYDDGYGNRYRWERET